MMLIPTQKNTITKEAHKNPEMEIPELLSSKIGVNTRDVLQTYSGNRGPVFIDNFHGISQY